ncbi:tetratricopeptide repeat protein [Nocardiopsis mangrovi]|uniref:non-specific serine/threonine protein kinase n=1 Tax=Nocardiopsis mangrovi TaxID=1179818 RepID=A0ABV9E1I6_9ACTN
MNPCTGPGCPGTVDDGYCDVCGMAPAGSESVAPMGPHGFAPTGPEWGGAGRYAWSARTDRSAPSARGGQWASEPSVWDGVSEPSGLSHVSGLTGLGISGIIDDDAAARLFQDAPEDPGGRADPAARDPRGGPGGPRTTSGPSDRSRRSPSSARGMLGLGMVQVPPVPYRDPETAVMADPVVAEKNRFCGRCNARVGRSRGGRPGRTEGYCRSCRAPYSFTPKLKKGDLVGGQYEVLGCLAHGGLGWIYLARDHNVSDRWVVLKGLLNSGDAEAHKTATAERAFLAEVEHPNIVKIYNFVQHPDPRTGIPAGHIVMEYVGGKSLRDLIVERRQQGSGDEALPVEQVIAYGLEILRALGYLHHRGLLYCDFKPDNVIQSEEQIKLIDLGAVRRMDDMVNSVYTTPGYRVPESELRGPGPSISSDLYSVGRSLAVLSLGHAFIREHPYSLPEETDEPVLRRYESYHRLLRRATHPFADQRFHLAADMAEQLTGVLREVLSDIDGRPHPAASGLFGPEHFRVGVITPTGPVDGTDRLLRRPDPAVVAAALPVPLVDPQDQAAQLLAGLSSVHPEELVATLEAVADPSPETRLMLARALITLGRPEAAAAPLEAYGVDAPGDWRIFWYRALMALSIGDHAEAYDRFDELFGHLPGEAAPRLGLAAACEGRGRLDAAARHYRAVWYTDHSYVSAAFGLARTRLAQDDRDGAVDVLDTVPDRSSLYLTAQMAAVAARVAAPDPAGLDENAIVDAGARLERLGLRGESGDLLATRVLGAALGWVLAGRSPAFATTLLGDRLTEAGLRGNLERTYRALARVTADAGARHGFVDLANAVRPRTWT